MATRISGKAVIHIDYVVAEDLTDLQAEQEFNHALEEVYKWDDSTYGWADYDQQHEYDSEDGADAVAALGWWPEPETGIVGVRPRTSDQY